jgi:hypothetical protein
MLVHASQEECIDEGTLASQEIFGQSKLSWLTSIMVPPERRTRRQFLPIAYFMANLAGILCSGTRHRRARPKSHSKPHSEEKNFANRIFHGE